MPITLDACAHTDPGRLRKRNEDTVFQKIVTLPGEDDVGLFIVADGVGGRLAGKAASYWAVETVKNALADLIDHRDPRATNRFDQETILNLQAAIDDGSDPDNLKQRVQEAVRKANSVVREYARQRPSEARDAGSTLSLALVQGHHVTLANVGDSRAYILRDERLHQITTDHSLVQRLIDTGRIKPEHRFTHPRRNLIYRSLGASETVESDIFTVEVVADDRLLLCSDGLWEMVRDPQIITQIIRKAPSVEAACEQLVTAANAAGGEDNIGIVLVRVRE
jgi:serine/threonine protein phosphatase PrpC